LLYLIRHCQTSGQEHDAPLTPLGQEQAETLATFLSSYGIKRIVSSTHLRARQSVEPLAARLRLPVETDPRLIERVLSGDALPDWRERLLDTWADFDLTLPGGESSRAATTRALAALDDALATDQWPVAVVAHGNLIALLLHALDGRPGYETWTRLTNPDVFLIEPQPSTDRSSVPRQWPVRRLWPV
jgi:2,3-bisphosphoglycerate-dependent phosphoglycerate mutase